MPNDSSSTIPTSAASGGHGRKTRTGTKHSRNGCITCKIRHIKCDEAKPACVQCKHTGRKCDGYVANATKTKVQAKPLYPKYTSTINFQNPLLDFAGTKTEHRFLAFFNENTAPGISGCFDDDFWGELLPRMGQTEPTIQHAMIALAAVHARMGSMLELVEGADKHARCQLFQLQQYNKAIYHLKRHLSEEVVSQEVALLSCVLLIFMEFLQGNVGQGWLHLYGGMAIFKSYCASISRSPGVNPHSDWLARKLINIFFHLGDQAFLSGRAERLAYGDFKINPEEIPVEERFFTIDDARASQIRILSPTYRFIHSAISSHYKNISPNSSGRSSVESLAAMRLILSTKLQRWSDAFESFVAQKGTLLTGDKGFNGVTMLRIYHIMASILLSTCTTPAETAFDTHLQEFSSLLTLASSLQNHFSSGAGLYTFDMGAIAPLYFVITACRDQKLRRQALLLLHTYTPRREGVWDANILEYVGRSVMEAEEAMLHERATHSDLPSLEREKLMPAEQDRIVDVTILPKYDPFNEPKSFAVAYMTKSSDGKSWSFRKEDVVLGSDGIFQPAKEVTYTKRLEIFNNAVAPFKELRSFA